VTSRRAFIVHGSELGAGAFLSAVSPSARRAGISEADGGIYCPVNLLITPKVFIERVDLDAVAHIAERTADVSIFFILRNLGTRPWVGSIEYCVTDEETGLCVLEKKSALSIHLVPGETKSESLRAATLHDAKFWHFDHPHLYRLRVLLTQRDQNLHALEATFGVRSIEAKNAGFYLNGERVRFVFDVQRPTGFSALQRYGSLKGNLSV